MQTFRHRSLFVLGLVALAGALILGTVPGVGAEGQGGGGATLNVRVTNTPLPVDVANVPDVNVANTPSVTVANTPAVNVTSLPAVSLTPGTTVRIDPSDLVPTAGASALYPIVVRGSLTLSVGQSGASTPVLYTVPAGWRLVVEHVSCVKSSSMLPGDYMGCGVVLSTPTFTGAAWVGSAGPFGADIGPGIVASPIKLFFDPGRPVSAAFSRAVSAIGADAGYSITINGYLVPVS